MKIYFDIFLSFLKIGAFTLGGGYAMIPLVEKEVVDRKGWLQRQDFLDLIAVTQAMPGVVAINMAVFVGYKIRGVKGSVATALGAALPSFVIILLIAIFFAGFKDNPVVERVFRGIRPAVVALIAVPAITTARAAGVTCKTVFIPVGIALLIWLAHVSPVYIVAAAAAGGIIFQRTIEKKNNRTTE